MKRTYQPSKIRRARTHGFLVRMKTSGGPAVINARRAKGRKRLAVWRRRRLWTPGKPCPGTPRWAALSTRPTSNAGSPPPP